MESLFRLSATEAKKHLLAGELTAKDLILSCLKRIQETDFEIKAWECYDPQVDLYQAEAVDRKIAQQEPVGKLAGIPIGIKDVFNTQNYPTCMGSPIWKGFTPGNDARTVFYMREEDGIILGKTKTAEFAVHASPETRNPHHFDYSPGTSSSGSAAAVAAYQVPLATGTQTAGSIIRPASYCGVLGYKPSFGVIPRTGVLKTTDTLDTIGMFARNVDDIQLLFDVMRVRGRNFPFIYNTLENLEKQSKNPNEPWKILVVTDQLWVWNEADDYARQAFKDFIHRLGKLDGVVVEIAKLPQEFNQAHQIHSVIYDKTLAYYFKDEFKKHTLISPIMYEIISRGQNITLEQYLEAIEKQNKLIHQLDAMLSCYDALIALSTSGEAPKWGGDDKPDSSLVWTLCHTPSINLPLFRSPRQLPFGAQLVSRRYYDYHLFHLARILEKEFRADFFLNSQPAVSA